tara:strand:- start:1344 stop:1724 length:381 start_codon:yes stop_codon:yes gene_type:complete
MTIVDVEPMSIDQLAGSFVLTMGAIGSLLLVIWQSRCLCKCRIGCSDKCYIFDCSREPPPLDETSALKDVVPKEEEEENLGPVAEANIHGRPDMIRLEETLVPPKSRTPVAREDDQTSHTSEEEIH